MANVVYNLLFKRSSTFTLVIITSSFMFERAVNLFTDKMFDSINKGKQWKDIKHQYEK